MIDDQVDAVDALEARLVEAENELAAMCDLESALQSAIDERDAAWRELAAVRQELAVVKQDVVDVRNSTSWRVTAPLRQVSERRARRRDA